MNLHISESRTCIPTTTDIIFALDSSSTLTQSDFDKMKNYVVNIIQMINTDTDIYRVGVIEYNSKGMSKINLLQHRSKQALIRAINALPFMQGARKIRGIMEAVNKDMFNGINDRRDATNMLVLITNGVPRRNSEEMISQANTFKEAGGQVYVIGVGMRENNQINAIASQPLAEHRMLVQNYDEFPEITSSLFDGVCVGNAQGMMI